MPRVHLQRRGDSRRAELDKKCFGGRREWHPRVIESIDRGRRQGNRMNAFQHDLPPRRVRLEASSTTHSLLMRFPCLSLADHLQRPISRTIAGAEHFGSNPSHPAQHSLDRPSAVRIRKEDLANAAYFRPVIPPLEQRQMSLAQRGRRRPDALGKHSQHSLHPRFKHPTRKPDDPGNRSFRRRPSRLIPDPCSLFPVPCFFRNRLDRHWLRKQ